MNGICESPGKLPAVDVMGFGSSLESGHAMQSGKIAVGAAGCRRRFTRFAAPPLGHAKRSVNRVPRIRHFTRQNGFVETGFRHSSSDPA